jgi:hypothetical protein
MSSKEKGGNTMLVYDVNNLYDDLIYRIISVFSLNQQAYKILSDSIILNNYKEIFRERSQMQDVNNRLTYDYPISEKVIHNYVLENVKIALALEINLKSSLLYKGYIVHLIRKNGTLKKDQKSRPISITEYISEYGNNFCDSYLFENSLNLTSFEQADYISVLNLDNDFVNILKHFRTLRNSVHLPINIPTGLSLENDKINRLVKYVNEDIIDLAYKIADDHKFNRNFNYPKF